MVQGVTGSGKSTVAARLSGTTGIDWYSVDDLAWQPGWEMLSVEDQRRVFGGLCAKESWVLDNTYRGWMDLALDRADLIVALDYPRWVSLGQLLRRTLRRVRTGQLVCNGNRETWRDVLSRDSIILWHFRSFTRKRRRVRAWQQDSPGPGVLLFTHRRDLDDWLRTLGPATPTQ